MKHQVLPILGFSLVCAGVARGQAPSVGNLPPSLPPTVGPAPKTAVPAAKPAAPTVVPPKTGPPKGTKLPAAGMPAANDEAAGGSPGVPGVARDTDSIARAGKHGPGVYQIG